MNAAVTAAIINWNSGSWLGVCVRSLVDTREAETIMVVDNASNDDSLRAIDPLRNEITVIENSVNRGFASAVNQAFEVAETPLILVLNPDIQALAGSISHLRKVFEENPSAGAAGGYVNDKYLPRAFPTVGSLVRENLGIPRMPAGRAGGTGAIAADQPAAAALMIRREAFDAVGGFDEQFHPAWYEDVDFCFRLKQAGWLIYFVPEAKFLHGGGYSVDQMGFGQFAPAYYRNQLRFARKHLGLGAYWTVRLSIGLGMIGRMALKPRQARAYARVLGGVLGKRVL